MEYIENQTFDEISIGESASLTRTLTKDDILLFAAMSGDVNPAHIDEEFAQSDVFQKIIAHGMWGAALISTVLGTLLPGPGTIYVGQTLRFRRPVAIGDEIVVSVRAQEKNPEKRRVTFECKCTNQAGDVVIAGTAEVIAPADKIKRPKMVLPEVRVYNRHPRYRELLGRASRLQPVRTAVVHPADGLTVVSALEAAQAGLIEPIFIGSESRIRAFAKGEGRSVEDYTIVSVTHSHEAASRAIAMTRAMEADVVMTGTLAIEELTRAATAADTGLRSARQISHAIMFDVPNYPRPIFLTDALLNVDPTVQDKRDIIQNAVDLLHALGNEVPKVAILGAVERVEANILSIMEATALCKMADRGEISGATLDGPLVLGTAISHADGKEPKVDSPVAEAADILLVPCMEVGQAVVQQLRSLGAARIGALVLGARVPIVLSEQGDTEGTLTASCALAMLVAHAHKRAVTVETPARPIPSP